MISEVRYGAREQERVDHRGSPLPQKPASVVRGGGRGDQNGGPAFASLSPRLSLFIDHLRTVLAVKGLLRRAQQRRALDCSGPFRTTPLRRGKGSLRTAPLAGDHFAAILVPFFAATDTVSHCQAGQTGALSVNRYLDVDSVLGDPATARSILDLSQTADGLRGDEKPAFRGLERG